jgi:hypothetical protein
VLCAQTLWQTLAAMSEICRWQKHFGSVVPHGHKRLQML